MDARRRSREWYRGRLAFGRAPVTRIYAVIAASFVRRPRTRILKSTGCMVGNDLTRSAKPGASASSWSSLSIVAMVRASWTGTRPLPRHLQTVVHPAVTV